ncbi:MAG: glycosyltransferase [Candidatus Yanofskybacteria bacterium]|nr:glycosyltransferase [Candidatus Yanofskybacteria bacterium]
MKLAIVHDWIIDIGGAERVLIALHRLWPTAPIYTLVAKPDTVRTWLPDATIVTSGLQRFPRAWTYHSLLAPLMPAAVESFDLSAFDTVISSSVLFSKGVVVRPGTRHISYCYSPSRMLWDRSAAYERRGVFSRLYRHGLRLWDAAAAQRPDELVAVSATSASRIAKYYRRSAVIVPPPTRTVQRFDENRTGIDGGFFLIVARLVPHKELDLVIGAFAKLRYRLVIVGDGPLRSRLARRASENITLMGAVSDERLDELYSACQAVVVPNEEDWGLTAIEAMAHGKPVLALRRGGATETILEGVTGEFFDDPIPEALADGIKRIKGSMRSYDPEYIRAHASQWNTERFEQRMRTLFPS